MIGDKGFAGADFEAAVSRARRDSSATAQPRRRAATDPRPPIGWIRQRIESIVNSAQRPTTARTPPRRPPPGSSAASPPASSPSAPPSTSTGKLGQPPPSPHHLRALIDQPSRPRCSLRRVHRRVPPPSAPSTDPRVDIVAGRRGRAPSRPSRRPYAARVAPSHARLREVRRLGRGTACASASVSRSIRRCVGRAEVERDLLDGRRDQQQVGADAVASSDAARSLSITAATPGEVAVRVRDDRNPAAADRDRRRPGVEQRPDRGHLDDADRLGRGDDARQPRRRPRRPPSRCVAAPDRRLPRP